MNRPVVAAALLTAAATGAVVLVLAEWVQPVPEATPAHVCVAVADLQDALDLSSVGDQAVLRARAAHVADLLRAPSRADLPGSRPVARRMVAVLGDPGATVSDLATAIGPIVRECRG